MKRILSLVLAISLVCVCLAGCGSSSDRILYNTKLSKYVDLGDYEGLEIDTQSEDFKTNYESVVDSDIESYGLYEKKNEGTVAEGDTANIDYEGKKDGVAFSGGTDTGYDLTIGSNSFIDGFEEGLIGVEIGDTVDLNLTFPEDYGNEELNGQDVVFTVTVNYVTTTTPLTSAEFYSELGFASEEEYIEDAEIRAAKNILLTKLQENSEIKAYPEEDQEYIYEETKNLYVTNYIEPYGYDFESYLAAAEMTEDDFKNDLMENTIEPLMDTQLLLYSVLDKAKLEVTSDEITAEAMEIAAEYDSDDVTAEQILEYYGEYYIEYYVVSEKALQYMYDNAKIK